LFRRAMGEPAQSDADGDDLIADALSALRGPAVSVSRIDADQSGNSGLYAVFGSALTWKQLRLGAPPDDRPLYVGKAEKTLAARDVQDHFGAGRRDAQSPTGSSTLRRSLAALLAAERGYRGVPRNPDNPGYFSCYGLSVEHDEDLSQWMARRLRLALWPQSGVKLATIETAVLIELAPPLNIEKVVTPWRSQVKTARKALAQEARSWPPQ
jgi:hypothetical protein